MSMKEETEKYFKNKSSAKNSTGSEPTFEQDTFSNCRYIEEECVKIVKKENTFFAPAQKLNRDFSILLIKHHFKSYDRIRILSTMAATGLRELRYLREIPNAQLFINDISLDSIKTIENNLRMNGWTEYRKCKIGDDIRKTIDKITIIEGDCTVLMNTYHGFFDVIDIDPFGSCAPFVNDAAKAIKHNGLICFTCTDKAVLCSNERKCYVRYNTLIPRGFCLEEMPIRVLLSYISREYGKYGYSISPVFSFSVDYYLRVFVKIIKGKPTDMIKSNGMLALCGCGERKLFRIRQSFKTLCELCGKEKNVYGPFWIEKIFNREVTAEILENIVEKGNERVVGILRYMYQEIDEVFYYDFTELCARQKTTKMKLRDLMNLISNAGYKASLVYYDQNSLKTNCPVQKIDEIMRTSLNDYISNEDIDKIFAVEYYKKYIRSGLGPGSLPKSDYRHR